MRPLPMLAGGAVFLIGSATLLHVLRPDLTLATLRPLLGSEEPAGYEAAAPRHPGDDWRGVESGRRNVTVLDPVEQDDGRFAMRYRSEDRSGRVQRGTLMVQTMGPRMSAFLTLEDGTEVRGYNGILSPDGRMITGQTWAIPEGSPTDRGELFWFTVERGEPAEPGRLLDVNALSVGELEAGGVTPEVARLIVEGRLARGPYLSLAPLTTHPRVSAPQRHLIQERGVVR